MYSPTPLKKQAVQMFCHSDEASSIDTNQPNSFVLVDNVKHVKRVWQYNTVHDLYLIFKQSEVVQQMKQIHPTFVIPSYSFFRNNLCKCCSKPKMQSCVDITTSSVNHYMKALQRYISANRHIREKLHDCNCEQHQSSLTSHQWQSLLNGTVENLVEATCCPRISHEHLKYGAGSGARTPKLLKWNCVKNLCEECGIEKKLKVSTCPILMQNNDVIEVLEWH